MFIFANAKVNVEDIFHILNAKVNVEDIFHILNAKVNVEDIFQILIFLRRELNLKMFPEFTLSSL